MAIIPRCPQCGAQDVRVCSLQGLGELLRRAYGRYTVRCRRCGHRFEAAIWRVDTFKYARCPKCYRLELTTWSERLYNVPFSIRVRLRLGATRYRCEYCRCNFASFRLRKERFSM
jgi:hypothetical protein